MSARRPTVGAFALALDQADDAGAADAGDDLVDAEFLEFFGDEGGRIFHREEEFGPGVDVAAPFGDLVLQLRGSVQNRHIGVPVMKSRQSFIASQGCEAVEIT